MIGYPFNIIGFILEKFPVLFAQVKNKTGNFFTKQPIIHMNLN